MPGPNRLATESSPYLRQHRGNPVDWYPWGDEAFERARREQRPILLSIGYSSCHWCHVMAHESFENADTAAVMNELFVNVKVDREERPDVDEIYMNAVQAMTGSGGWPLTVFLTPEGRPFYGGTYFPPAPRHGLPGFVELCRAVYDAWQTRRDEVVEQADRLTEAIGQGVIALGAPADSLPGHDAVDAALAGLRGEFDPDWGGFGPAPKFPRPDSLELLLSQAARTRADDLMLIAGTTLDAMASGGIYDHLGGGFARYSTDRTWLVPHFEKMLYDQALLVRAYLHAWQLTGRAEWLQVVSETVGYVLRELRLPDGGLASAEDADSEGVEGKFYVWDKAEVEAVAGADGRAAVEWFGVSETGNWEGTNILWRPVRGELIRPDEVERARAALFEARARRVRPGLDDKVLTEWNALFLSSLAEAAAATGNDRWLAAAVDGAEFLLARLRRDDGRWLRAWQREAGARHLAFAADYAALVDAFTRLGEATGQARWTALAVETADALLDLFWDDAAGGLFTTGRDAERLITRSKDLLDNATPSANSAAASALTRLGALTGNTDYEDRATAIVRLVADPLSRYPGAFAHLLQAVDLLHRGVREVVVAGDRPDLVEVVHQRYLPDAVLAWGERSDGPLWDGRADGRAYVCRRFACRTPVADADALAAQLDEA